VTASRAVSLAGALALALLGGVGCGHKGPPLAPLRPVPVGVPEWAIERQGAAVRVTFTVPEGNQDQSAPPAVDRVEVFAATRPAGQPAPTPAELLVPANVVGTVSIRPPDPPKPDAPPDSRPAAGDKATFVDAVAGADADAVRYSAVAPAAGRRRGPGSSVLRVPLSAPPPAPANLTAAYTEQTLTLAWQTASAADRSLVFETDESGGGSRRLTDEPQAAATFDLPVAFGRTRCFVVRAVEVRGAVAIVGEPAAPVCVTPRDHFPPPAPAGLLAVAADNAVELVWAAVSAADLAGYAVWRGDGATGTLQRITPAPVSATSYRDATVGPGATYVYAVTAVDAATPPNESQPSNRQVVTVRVLPARGPVER
jgi:hypothetical protein